MTNAPTLVDAYAASVATGVPSATIRWWAHKGRLPRRGRDSRGRTLYDLTDVEHLARTRAPDGQATPPRANI